MTTTTERPAPPRRPFTLIVPVLVAAAAFSIGGAFATTAQGRRMPLKPTATAMASVMRVIDAKEATMQQTKIAMAFLMNVMSAYRRDLTSTAMLWMTVATTVCSASIRHRAI